MKQNIYTKEDNLIIEIPLISRRSNPYDENYHPKMPNIAGLIEKNKGYDKLGFCYVIDMEYSGKDDQYSDFFFEYAGGKKEFEELCKKLKIGIIYA